MKSRSRMSGAGAWFFLAWLLALCAATGAAAAAETLYRGFRNTPRADSLMPYWFWNGEINAAESRRQLQDEAGQPITGFAAGDCVEIIGNEIERVIRWKSGVDVSS